MDTWGGAGQGAPLGQMQSAQVLAGPGVCGSVKAGAQLCLQVRPLKWHSRERCPFTSEAGGQIWGPGWPRQALQPPSLACMPEATPVPVGGPLLLL